MVSSNTLLSHSCVFQSAITSLSKAREGIRAAAADRPISNMVSSASLLQLHSFKPHMSLYAHLHMFDTQVDYYDTVRLLMSRLHPAGEANKDFVATHLLSAAASGIGGLVSCSCSIQAVKKRLGQFQHCRQLRVGETAVNLHLRIPASHSFVSRCMQTYKYKGPDGSTCTTTSFLQVITATCAVLGILVHQCTVRVFTVIS